MGLHGLLGAWPTSTFLLRRTVYRHLFRSRPRKILNVLQRIRRWFFGACGLASAGASFASSRMAISDRLLDLRKMMALALPAIVVFVGTVLGIGPSRAYAAVVSQLDLSGGSIALDFGSLGTMNRTFSQPGRLVMDRFQPRPPIFEPVTVGHLTLSLFTGDGGSLALPPPSGTISGSTINVDLRSLFASATPSGWGGILAPPSTPTSHQLNIGAIATGWFNESTNEFTISWTKSFTGVPCLLSGTFSLQGTAQLAEVPLPGAVFMFGSGLVGLGALHARRHPRIKTGPEARHV